MKDLTSHSLTAFFWGAGGAVTRIVLQLVTQIALARILGPEQYGLFAIGAIVVSFSNFFSDIGIAYGLIQKRDVSHEDLRFVFTWQIILGSLVTFAIVIFSDEIASFFGETAASGVVLSLAGVCLLNALAAPSNNMLKRQMNFKRIQLAQLSGYVGGYILVGLPLALSGAQVWALVVAWIVQSGITLVILYAGARHPLRLLFWHDDARSLSGYGATVFVTNVTNWMIGNIDRVIVGRFFSGREIGLYATSYNMLQSPTSALLGVLQPVFFSASARVMDDQARIAAGYYALVGAIFVFIFPAFASVSAVSETFVLAVYGESWVDAAVIFRPLALAMPLFLIWGMTTPLLWAGGKPGREFKTQLPVAVLWVGVSWLAAQHSLAMIGWAVCGMFALRCGVIIFMASRTLALAWRPLWAALRAGLVISIPCAITTATLDLFLQGPLWGHPVLRLALEVLAGILVYLLLLARAPGVMTPELAVLLDRFADRCPNLVARYLHALSSRKVGYVVR